MCTKLSNIEKIAKIWQLQLNLEYENQDRNVRLSFKDIGPFCEFLAIDYNPKFVGSGSGGMGLDLSNFQDGKAIECKSCCTIQNAKCTSCGAKFNSLFSDICPICNSSEYNKVHDSRFSVNAKELLAQIENGMFENLTLCHMFLKDASREKQEISLIMRWYIISFSDDNILDTQLEYFRNQITKGKQNTCNLLPESFDFYKLRPQQFAETSIAINYASLEKRPKIVQKKIAKFYPRVPEKIIKKKSDLESFRKLDTYDSATATADSLDFTKNFTYKAKSLGKNRGDTRANIYKRLHSGLK